MLKQSSSGSTVSSGTLKLMLKQLQFANTELVTGKFHLTVDIVDTGKIITEKRYKTNVVSTSPDLVINETHVFALDNLTPNAGILIKCWWITRKKGTIVWAETPVIEIRELPFNIMEERSLSFRDKTSKLLVNVACYGSKTFWEGASKSQFSSEIEKHVATAVASKKAEIEKILSEKALSLLKFNALKKDCITLRVFLKSTEMLMMMLKRFLGLMRIGEAQMR